MPILQKSIHRSVDQMTRWQQNMRLLKVAASNLENAWRRRSAVRAPLYATCQAEATQLHPFQMLARTSFLEMACRTQHAMSPDHLVKATRQHLLHQQS